MAKTTRTYCESSVCVDEIVKARVFDITGDPMSESETAPSFADREFFCIIRSAFVEMAMQPGERALLQAIAQEAAKQKIHVSICRGTGGMFGNRAHHMEFTVGRNSDGTDKKGHLYSVTVTPEDDETLCLLQDASGKWHLGTLPFRRTLSHELIHIFYDITGKEEEFEKLPKSIRWSNGHEEAAITGEVPGAVVKFSENAFARARGEMLRLSHTCEGVAADKNQLFLKALALGCDGTVGRLMAESKAKEGTTDVIETAVSSFVESCLDEMRKSATGALAKYFPKNGKKITATLAAEHTQKTVADMFDLRAVAVVDISAARFNDSFYKDFTATTKVDLAFKEELETRKSKLFTTWLAMLPYYGYNDIAVKVEMRMDQFVKECQKNLEELGKIKTDLDRFYITNIKPFIEGKDEAKAEKKKEVV